MHFDRIFLFRIVKIVIHIGKPCPFGRFIDQVDAVFEFEPFKMETPILITLIGGKEFSHFHSQFATLLQTVDNDDMFPGLKYNTCHMLVCAVSVSDMQQSSQCFRAVYGLKGIYAELCIILPTM